MTLGQIAFEAYSESRGGKDVRGGDIPGWHSLDPGVANAWEAAADSVLQADYVERNGDEELLYDLAAAYRRLARAKPNDRSERDRRFAIAMTKYQDFLVWVNGAIVNDTLSDLLE